MVNNDRIVPIMKMDLLSMIGTVLQLIGTDYTVLAANGVEGDFEAAADGTYLANQPVKKLNFADGVAASTIYFVAGYDFEGFTVNGAEATIADGSAEIKPDGVTLYTAELASGEITVTAITPEVATA